ncbi:CoA pyrophosphatase [Bizionia gelidisalsuginis]|uniref:CoA pyrophosphatase n=2 Tax=Bizionia TaxID=283785 RepID=A0A8H2LG16_9FLAO|nr:MULTISPECIES: CoA pyrophosphatase [Bizionia]TYB77478.1 CoA pyrophosphatase [Bizionia saleffrena]TYC17841.1 CoA pyrophosphatase [Bizionia gelidisalsuginis]
MDFNEFLKLSAKIENLPVPAEPSQFKMSPPYRGHLVKTQKELIKNARKSAVMALFYPNANNETEFVLILRKTYKGVHSAQIGFPGGKLEANETDAQAALRETEEEIGVAQHHIEIVKEMTSLYIPPSNFFVQPFIGLLKTTPNFIKEDREVEAILKVKLIDFFNEDNVVTKNVSTAYDAIVAVPAYKLNNFFVWGATAMMLSEVKDLLKTAIK